MSDTLSWTLKLVDQISPSAKAAARALAGVKGQLDTVRRATQTTSGTMQHVVPPQALSRVRQFTQVLRGAGRAIGGLGRGGRGAVAGVAGLIEGPLGQLGAGLAGSAALGGAGVFALGQSIVRAAAERESALTSLRVAFGDANEAAMEYRNAIRIANQTPLDTQQVVGLTNQIAGMGIFGQRLSQIRGVLTDIGATNGPEAMASVARAFGQTVGKGRLQAEELMTMREMAPGFAQQLVPIIGQIMQLRGQTQSEINRAAMRAISAGRVDNTVFQQAFLEAGRRMNAHTGGALGGVARAQSQTLGGSLSNLSNAWGNLLSMMNDADGGLANLPGLRAFRQTIDATINALDVTTPGGMRAMTTLSTLFSGVFGALFGGAGAQGQNVIERLLSGLEQYTPTIIEVVGGIRTFSTVFMGAFAGTAFTMVRDALRSVGELMVQLGVSSGGSTDMIRAMGRAFGYIVGGFVLGVGVLGGAITLLVETFRALWGVMDLSVLWDVLRSALMAPFGQFDLLVDFFVGLPVRIVQGFLGGLRAEWGALIAEVNGLAAQLPASVRRVLGIHSPSRVMMEIGAHTVAGMEAGILGGQRDVEQAMSLLVSPRAGRQADAAGRAAAPISVQVVVNTDARDAEGVGDAVAARLEDLFADLFERAALGVG